MWILIHTGGIRLAVADVFLAWNLPGNKVLILEMISREQTELPRLRYKFIVARPEHTFLQFSGRWLLLYGQTTAISKSPYYAWKICKIWWKVVATVYGGEMRVNDKNVCLSLLIMLGTPYFQVVWRTFAGRKNYCYI